MDVKQSTAATVSIGPCLDSAGIEYTGLVIGDLSIRKHDGSVAAMAAAATLTHSANGVYTLVLTTGNTDTLGRLQIHCNKATYQIPPLACEVLHANVYDVQYGSVAPATATAVEKIQAAVYDSATAASNVITLSNGATQTISAAGRVTA